MIAQQADRTCPKCGSLVENRRADAIYCSDRCGAAAKTKRYADRQPADVRARWRQYFYTPRGTITALLGNASDRAKKLNLPFDLDREWLAEKLAIGRCELSGLALERIPRSSAGGSRCHPFAPSLDRIIPEFGYVKHNVRLVCFIVNQARSDFGDDALMAMARALVKELTA